MARPGRPERNRAARSFGQLRRFHHSINSDKVFGTHNPGFAVDLTLRGNIRDYVEVYLGHTKWRDVAGTTLQLDSDLQIARAFPVWLRFETVNGLNAVILVHGAWADGSSWAKVIPLLISRGVMVTAIQMPLAGFEGDVATLRRAAALAEPPVVLVGHSYGGAVITEAGTAENVSSLVYIAAFAPDASESAGSFGQTVEPVPMGAEGRPDAEAFLKLTKKGIRQDFAHDLSDVEQSVLFAAQAPTAGASLGGTVSRPAWRSKPSWYLVASEDRAIQPELERSMARRMDASVVEISSSHVAMLSHPDATADLILRAAQAT